MIGQEVETKRGYIQVRQKEKKSYDEGGETLEWVSHKGGRCLETFKVMLNRALSLMWWKVSLYIAEGLKEMAFKAPL